MLHKISLTRNGSAVAFLLVSTLLGFGYVAIKAGLAFFPPLLFAAFRIDIAAALLLAYVVLRTDGWRPTTGRDARAILAGGALVVFASNAFLFLGQQYTTSGVAAIIYGLDPVLATALAAFLLPAERLSRAGVAGLVVGLIGVTIVVQPNPSDLLGGDLEGEELVLLAATSIATGSVLVRRAGSSIPATAQTAWSMALAAPAMHAASLLAGESFAAVRLTETALVAMVYIGVFSTAIAYALYFELIDDVGPARASLVQYVIPIFAVLGGWALLGERLPPEAAVGFLLVFLGFVLLNADAAKGAGKRIRARSGAIGRR
ncbi:DMT family transporter [Halegenticoccus tardaugens]|uniref:DMT family transporter n=1 Tax=Halegenticoccus tardaugens TaxID=2071624 RepID=UPI0013E9926C|nr:EamA family transporter [Halegenticoccus tardaugens]